MNTKNSQKPVSKYAKKQAQGGSKYWDNMRSVIDAENRACALRMMPVFIRFPKI